MVNKTGLDVVLGVEKINELFVVLAAGDAVVEFIQTHLLTDLFQLFCITV